MTAEEIARKSAEAMWSTDAASKWLGMEMVEVAEGRAVFRLAIKEHHCNGHGILHGGVTFALADTAFAFACNSRNRMTVAQSNTITYLAPGRLGDVITATASEQRLSGRTGIYDVTVAREDGGVIAEFRGQSRALNGTLYEEQG